MDNLIKSLITLAFTLFVMGCSSTGKIDYMVAGGATQKGNEIWVQSITFDNSWGIPMGSLGCCWQSAGKTSGVYDQKFPEKVAVEWLDKSENRIYFGEVAIDKNGYQLAKTLPSYTAHTGKVFKDVKPYLIVGMGESGEIKVWISNTPYAGFTGRVLHELASGQARWRKNK
ncbi:DUF2931 family protein [Pseudoalteromonas sp. SWYJ118]|uniref:DUF2931 family protein n=1 Tax=Pseudoalteromonas sp. SWYJ118 TaxID=2792062 RepID=UPI0018CD4B50|nr:DUF2931 family protein [Pseudoalteromonas sp. SWYJ118]MBH0076097.1 DUF2931 family protein [Pseudoalteromonas sp. SWYJ118]